MKTKMRFAEPMPEMIRVRVAREEKRRLFELARERGISVSKFLRDAATEAAQRTAA
jgi:uncharacterized protein (DUF1778 family)